MPRKPRDDGPDLEALAKDLKETLQRLGKDAQEVLTKVADEAQYEFDRGTARLAAKHPDLYAELRKTVRQVQRTVDKAAESFGLKGKP